MLRINACIVYKTFTAAIFLLFVMLLCSSASAAPSKVIVSTNRYIVLDDPNYNLGGGSVWGSDNWNGESTTIRAYALVVDSKGKAIPNQAVTFSIPSIAGSSLTVNTNASGIASYAYQLNDAGNTGSKAPGNYTITATAGTVSGSTVFIYSYFGCSRCHGNKGLLAGSNMNPYSPYINTFNQMHAATTNKHAGNAASQLQGDQCNYCHTSYGSGTPTTSNPSTYGVHSITQKCSNCHDSGTGFYNSAAIIKDCAACHPKYNTKVTNYPSANFWNGTLIKFSSQPMIAHQASPAIPCIICHGPIHNTTTPDGMTSLNSFTSDTECTSCHVSQGKHSTSNPVYCTACHGQDAHIIGVLNKTASIQPSFVSVGSVNAMNASNCPECHSTGPEAAYFAGLAGMAGYGYTTNFTPATPVHSNHNGTITCTVCHDNTDFHSITFLTSSGTYSTSNASAVTCLDCHSGQNTVVRNLVNSKSGKLPPLVYTPLNHSNDGGGTKWGTYWTTPNGACLYCHGDSKHNATRLGTASVPVGTDPIGGTIGSGTVCSSCHNPADSNYAATMAVLTPDPVANRPGNVNWNTSGVDHSTYTAVTDSDCLSCHGGGSPVNISDFVHNVYSAKSGGPDCISCHNIGGSAPKLVNVTSLNNSAHKNLNNASSNVNLACYACHGNGSAPVSGHPPNYKTPKICADCHVNSSNYSAPLIAEHNQVGQQIITLNATCYTCHNNSGMIITNTGTNGTAHYVKYVTNISTTPYQHTGPINTSNCIVCHNGAYTNNSSWGSPVNISTSTKRQHNETLTSQCDACHNNGGVTSLALVDFHNSSVQPGAGGSCISCHSAPLTRYYVNTSLFGRHANVDITDGMNNVTDADCMVCHYGAANGTMRMASGAANHSNTYFCEDCHTSAGQGPVKPNPVTPSNPLIKDGLSHGLADCKWCHLAGDSQPRPLSPELRYHAGGAAGTAAGKDCTTCHYYANLPDLPFHAPGEMHSNVITYCAQCHSTADNHAVTDLNDYQPPSVQSISVTSPVTSGSPVQVAATISDAMLQIAAAQYQVANASGIVIDWTNMTPSDGRFDYPVEPVKASIDTSRLTGNYTVNVKGMASGPKTDRTKPYYPLNGQWSAISSALLTVVEANGYVNGTVRDTTGKGIAGATVATDTGVSTTADASGFYSLSLSNSTYQLTASKQPQYYPNSAAVSVTAYTTVTKDIVLSLKPVGSIKGSVTN